MQSSVCPIGIDNQFGDIHIVVFCALTLQLALMCYTRVTCITEEVGGAGSGAVKFVLAKLNFRRTAMEKKRQKGITSKTSKLCDIDCSECTIYCIAHLSSRRFFFLRRHVTDGLCKFSKYVSNKIIICHFFPKILLNISYGITRF